MSKILLVEDDEFLRTLYVDLLKEAKHTVTTAVDGDEAYEKIAHGGWDVVLLDVILPKMTGVEIIAKLKSAEPKALKQKIVFMSNADDAATVKSIEATGFPHVLKSEMNPEEFVERVKGFL